MKKSRFLYLDPGVNPGKVAALEALQAQYAAYLEVCVQSMLRTHRFSVALKDKQAFFPPCETLSSQIVKNVRDHAISIVSGWAAGKYTTKLKSVIKGKFNDGLIDEAMRSALCILGKCKVDKPGGKVTQEALDLYWSWLLDESLVGKTPSISSRCGMRMSEMTAVLETSEDTKLTAWWLGFSWLEAGKPRIQVPLVPSPYITKVEDASKGILARKTKRGRWRFEVVDKREWLTPEATEDMPRLAGDIGLNVLVATSDGRLLGSKFKPGFDRLYSKVKTVRANRQRQGFKENSPRLDCLESKLTGMTATCVGEVANNLVRDYLNYVFVIEDLDLSGCRGQKRFAYRFLHHSLECKVPCCKVNPAYTSQECPVCHYVSRLNRKGTKFICRSCGHKCHADVVGGRNLLGRSEDKEISIDDDPSDVRPILEARHAAWRQRQVALCALGRLAKNTALEPSSRRLTTRVSPSGETGTASNRVEAHA